MKRATLHVRSYWSSYVEELVHEVTVFGDAAGGRKFVTRETSANKTVATAMAVDKAFELGYEVKK